MPFVRCSRGGVICFLLCTGVFSSQKTGCRFFLHVPVILIFHVPFPEDIFVVLVVEGFKMCFVNKIERQLSPSPKTLGNHICPVLFCCRFSRQPPCIAVFPFLLPFLSEPGFSQYPSFLRACGSRECWLQPRP